METRHGETIVGKTLNGTDMRNLDDIQKLIDQGDLSNATTALREYIEAHPDSDNAHFLLGNIYRRQEDWQNAINAFQKAIELNPESPAVGAKESIYKILDFFNKDLFNQ